MRIRPATLPRPRRDGGPRVHPGALSLAAWASSAAVLLAATDAHAGSTTAEVNIFLGGGYMPQLPTQLSPIGTVYTNPDPENMPNVLQRELHGSIASRGASAYWVNGFDVRVVHKNTWVFPLFGLAFAGALGSSPAIDSSLDGTLVQMQPWGLGMFSVLLPGVGLRAHTLHMSVSLALRASFSVLWMGGVAAVGGGEQPFTATAVSLGVRGALDVCYRMDASQRLCFYAEPTVYEFGAFNGGALGVRLDWGP